MAWGVCDDEFSVVGSKEAVGYIDSNTLLSFGRQAVYQKREVDVTVLGTVVFGFIAQGCDLVFKN